MMEDEPSKAGLLAVDLGLRAGFALYGCNGRLRRYWSQRFPNTATLRRAVPQILAEAGGPAIVCLEGGGRLGQLWEKMLNERGIRVVHVVAEAWRGRLLYAREQRNGKVAKRSADGMARRIIDWSGAPRPTSLRHDTSEAILIGLWAVLDAGWLEALPREIHD